jgi:hypothetical protein
MATKDIDDRKTVYAHGDGRCTEDAGVVWPPVAERR